MNKYELIKKELEDKNGILRLKPVWVYGEVIPSGNRLKDMIKNSNTNKDNICERFLGSTIGLGNNDNLYDYGISMVIIGNDNIEVHDGAGSIYNLARNDIGLIKAGEWNEMKVYALGPHVATYLNGKKAAEAFNMVTLKGAIGVSPKRRPRSGRGVGTDLDPIHGRQDRLPAGDRHAASTRATTR